MKTGYWKSIASGFTISLLCASANGMEVISSGKPHISPQTVTFRSIGIPTAADDNGPIEVISLGGDVWAFETEAGNSVQVEDQTGNHDINTHLSPWLIERGGTHFVRKGDTISFDSQDFGNIWRVTAPDGSILEYDAKEPLTITVEESAHYHIRLYKGNSYQKSAKVEGVTLDPQVLAAPELPIPVGRTIRYFWHELCGISGIREPSCWWGSYDESFSGTESKVSKWRANKEGTYYGVGRVGGVDGNIITRLTFRTVKIDISSYLLAEGAEFDIENDLQILKCGVTIRPWFPALSVTGSMFAHSSTFNDGFDSWKVRSEDFKPEGGDGFSSYTLGEDGNGYIKFDVIIPKLAQSSYCGHFEATYSLSEYLDAVDSPNANN